MVQVLVVEDDKSHADMVKQYLDFKELESHVVYSGQSAIDWLDENSCQLIITDIRMPNGSGIDLMQWNRQTGPNLPVIVISGDLLAERESRQFCEIMGVPYLSKPVELDVLHSEILKCLAVNSQ
ncbi:MAG: response regulator [Lentisphaeraceae bacterium]|nr:response regulator [Lentisphaeraceae bacterium]